MWKRIRQFTRALMAKGPDDKEYKILQKYLPDEAEKAFLNMTVPDQRHVLNVYYTAELLLQKNKLAVDEMLLYRCCLLHDIGRGRKMGTFCKTLSVILDKMCHDWAVQKGNEGNGFLGDMLYHYYHHAELSADMLQKMNMEKTAEIVALHHKNREDLLFLQNKGNEAAGSNELKILMEADDLN